MDAGKRNKILVVDDVHTNLVLMKAVLAKQYDVATALSGVKILELIETEKPDLILLDIMMAGMDGFEVLNVIRNNEPTKDLPVIMVTALANTEEVSKAYELGANDYISKPIVIAQLLSAVKTQLTLVGK